MEPKGWGFKSSVMWGSTFRWAVTDISTALQSFKTLATPNPKTVSHASRVKSSAELVWELQTLHSTDNTVISQLFWAKIFHHVLNQIWHLMFHAQNTEKIPIFWLICARVNYSPLCQGTEGWMSPRTSLGKAVWKKIPPPTGIWTPVTPHIATLLRDK